MSWLQKLFGTASAPEPRQLLPLTLQDIPGTWRSGGWTPRWENVKSHIQKNYSEEQRDDAYWAVATSWLNNLQKDLGSPYSVLSSEHFLLLSPYPAKKAERQIKFLELLRSRLCKYLGSQDELESGRPYVVLFFYDSQEFVAYLSHFGTQMEQGGGSCGTFISRGYPHIAIYDERIELVENSLAHDLTLNLLSNYPLPQWLLQGLAQLAPQELALSGSTLSTIKEEQDQIREAWKPNVIKQFWSGTAFSPGDKRHKRAFQLAEVLTRILYSEPGLKKSLPVFISKANRQDCGESAAVEYLGAGLGSWVGQFLGEGEWGPRV
ncbi:unnamed protein product [Phaeothamnion confervicola]